MQALDLNLASHPFKNNTLLWVGFSLASLVLGALSVDNVVTWRGAASALADLESKVGGIETRQQDLTRRANEARREISRYDVPTLVIRTEKANEVIRWKAFSWTRLFNELEAVQPWDVQMTSIHPTFRPEQPGEKSGGETNSGVPVVVEGSARSLEAFLDLERGLIRSQRFTRVEPERTAVDPETRETVFRLRFIYNPDVPVGPPPAPPEPAAEAVADEAVAEQPEAVAAAAPAEVVPDPTVPTVEVEEAAPAPPPAPPPAAAAPSQPPGQPPSEPPRGRRGRPKPPAAKAGR